MKGGMPLSRIIDNLIILALVILIAVLVGGAMGFAGALLVRLVWGG